MKCDESTTEASRWGLPPLQEIEQLGDRLDGFYDRFRPLLRTQTRDSSHYGLAYVSSLLRMDSKRNIAEIGRQAGTSPQNMQHFITNSPWSYSALIHAIQADILRHPEFQSGAILVLDESAEQKAGEHSAGAGAQEAQHNGRLGKVEMSQVGVFLSLVTPQVNTWIDMVVTLADRPAPVLDGAGIPEKHSGRQPSAAGWCWAAGP